MCEKVSASRATPWPTVDCKFMMRSRYGGDVSDIIAVTAISISMSEYTDCRRWFCVDEFAD